MTDRCRFESDRKLLFDSLPKALASEFINVRPGPPLINTLGRTRILRDSIMGMAVKLAWPVRGFAEVESLLMS
jgi:hypothetical protein